MNRLSCTHQDGLGASGKLLGMDAAAPELDGTGPTSGVPVCCDHHLGEEEAGAVPLGSLNLLGGQIWGCWQFR